MRKLIVYKDRTNVVQLNLGFDVSADIITSQIREQTNKDSTLIATWTVAFAGDGTDGQLILTLDNSLVAAITRRSGFMDIKRLSGGEPLPVFDSPLEVEFLGSVTV